MKDKMKHKKEFLLSLALCSLRFARPPGAAADESPPDRIHVSKVRSQQSRGLLLEAFRQGLRDLGYIEGKNILVEYRYAEERAGPLSEALSAGSRATQGRCACQRKLGKRSARPSRRPRRFPLSW